MLNQNAELGAKPFHHFRHNQAQITGAENLDCLAF